MSVNEKMTAIADAIRDKTGREEKLGLDAMAAGVGEVYEAGKQAEYDAFWDAYQENGQRTNYTYAFYNRGWVDATFNPKYDIVAVGNAANLFAYSKFTDTKVAINLAGATNINGLFNYCTFMHTIRKLIVSNTTPFSGNSFGNCPALENITIEGTIANSIGFPQSSLLSTDSVNSVINALKDLTGATSQTLTFHAEVGASLTDAQKAVITAKNWTLVY